MDKQTEQVETEVSTPQTALLREGASLVRLENMTQMQIAVSQKRDEREILKEALNELDLYPSLAEKVFYTKPVGKDETGKMKYVTGLSIRTAESLANRWTNSAFGGDITGSDAESTTIGAVFLDYQKNIRHAVSRRVSRYYTTRNKQVVMYSPDRFETTVAANMSKILREVILRSLPAGLKIEYEKKAKEILRGGNKKAELQAHRERMLAAFATHAITQADLEALRSKPLKDFTADDLTELHGIYNAMEDGETTKDEILSGLPKAETKPAENGLKVKAPAPVAETPDPAFVEKQKKEIAKLKKAEAKKAAATTPVAEKLPAWCSYCIVERQENDVEILNGQRCCTECGTELIEGK